MQLLSQTTPRARRLYVCDWCNGGIKTGERHACDSYADGGRVYNNRFHAECRAAMHREYDLSRDDVIYLTRDCPRGLTFDEYDALGERGDA